MGFYTAFPLQVYTNEGEVPVRTESESEEEQDVQPPPAKEKRAGPSL